jgi:hypothetical protein
MRAGYKSVSAYFSFVSYFIFFVKPSVILVKVTNVTRTMTDVALVLPNVHELAITHINRTNNRLEFYPPVICEE